MWRPSSRSTDNKGKPVQAVVKHTRVHKLLKTCYWNSCRFPHRLWRVLTRQVRVNALIKLSHYCTRARRMNNCALLIGYPLTNRISPKPLARRMPFLRAISALDWAVIYNKHLESVPFGFFIVLTPGSRRKTLAVEYSSRMRKNHV